MKKRIAFITLALFIIYGISAEESAMLNAFQRNFARGSLSTKIRVLQDASQYDGQEMGPLYLQAVEFVYDNFQSFQNDPVAQELSLLAIRMIGSAQYTKASGNLWKLFELDKTTVVRMEIANSLGIVASDNKGVIQSMNRWLSSQNSVFRSGSGVDLQVVREVVIALGKLGDESSFPIILSAAVNGYSSEITRKSYEALTMVKGDYSLLITEVIRKGTVAEKLAALRLMYSSDSLPAEAKGEISVITLETALSLSSSDLGERDLIRQLRYESIRAISALKWSKATALVIQHFNRTIEEWDRGIGGKSFLLEAISCLGSMGTHEAAVRLTMYLELINSYVDNGQAYDEQVVLTVIKNLELLGDKVAFDYLLYTGYLNYSERVKQAAREALQNL